MILIERDFFMQIYGYARVSTKEQHTDRQIYALTQTGVNEKNIFTDKFSGRSFDRPQYKKLSRKLKAGDILYVKDIKRFGRNYNEILENWREITKKICADIIILDMPLLDTTRYKDLLGTFISDLVLQILSFNAQNDREDILKTQSEGIERAKNRGVRFGRPPIAKPENYEEVKNDYQANKISSRKAGDLLKVSQRKFLTWIKE
jgi:DNA invertase Pin-like site-specific DNA recombinase